MPVMEGKAMLFKEFAQVDAFPVCLATNDPEEIIQTVKLIAPTFGGINLEDISAPRLLRDRGPAEGRARHPRLSRRSARHRRGRHGGAVQLAEDRRQADREPQGAGAGDRRRRRRLHEDDAGIGITEIIGCDRQGAISVDRADYQDGSMSEIKRWFTENTNPVRLSGGPDEVIEGCDVFIGVSGPGLLEPESLGKMARTRSCSRWPIRPPR